MVKIEKREIKKIGSPNVVKSIERTHPNQEAGHPQKKKEETKRQAKDTKKKDHVQEAI